MKIISLFALLLLALPVFAQPGGIPVIKKDSCYKQADARKKQRFPEWECGKIAAVVDCNEKLELDEASNTVITASGKQPFTGTCETCHMNGLLERRVTFVNGKTNGTDTTKYATGCPMVIRTHIQGVENGRWTFFYDSLGTVAWEENYMVGQKNGPQIYYSRKEKASIGDTLKFETYTNGILNGPKITYDSKGKRSKLANYVNGLLDGAFLIYNPQGVIIEELNYVEGKRDGVFKYYYDDGKLLRTEVWSMDAKNGEFKTFFYDQSLQTLETYRKTGSDKGGRRIEAEVYECRTKQVAQQVFDSLSKGRTAKQIMENIDMMSPTVKLYPERFFDPEAVSYLEGKKLEQGVNKPYEIQKKYYVVKVTKITRLTKLEYKDGWFEEYFPDKKLKRRAFYKKDVMTEEHVFDETGREIKTFGVEPAATGDEDDAVPTDNKKKKKSKKSKSAEPEKP